MILSGLKTLLETGESLDDPGLAALPGRAGSCLRGIMLATMLSLSRVAGGLR